MFPSRQSNGHAVVAFVAVLAFTCVNANFDPSLDLHRFQLTRNSVPVTRNGKVVSHKTIYAGNVHLGSPPQPFRVVFDTGSGHVVLPSVECITQQCTVHSRYNHSLSRTGVSINIDKSIVKVGEAMDEVTVSYGTGEITGDFVKEHVCLGSVDVAQDDKNCVQMGFIKATELSYNPFLVVPVDGIFGLGLPSLALDPDFSFFEVLVRGRNINMPQFSVFIGEGDEESELAVGGHNPAHLASPLKWTSVAMADKGHWQVNIIAIHIGDYTLDICKDGSCRGIVDTGTSHIGIPADSQKLVDRMVTRVAGDLENCREVEAPSISIELPGFNLTLEPENYMRPLPLHGSQISSPKGVVHPNAPAVANASKSSAARPAGSNGKVNSKARLCKPLLMPVRFPEPLGPNLFIFGEPLLRRYYTVFDWAQPAMGFGLATNTRQTHQTEDTLIFMQQQTEKNDDGSFTFLQIVVHAKRKRTKTSVTLQA